MDRSGSLRIPARSLIAHILQAHRPADRLRQQGRVHRRVAGVVAAVTAWTRHPHRMHVVGRYAKNSRDAVTGEVRLLRSGPQRDLAVLDVDHGAGRSHAGMRLERPLVFRLDDAGRRLESILDVADILAGGFRLAHRSVADVVVDRSLIRERRRGLRPLDLELPHRLDRIPFLVGDDAEEALVPDHLGAGNVLDRAFVDFYRYRAGDRRPDHAAVHHAGHFHVGDEVLLGEDFWRDVLALDRLTDDLVIFRVLRLGFAGRVKRIADLLVPVELDVEVATADQIGIADLLRGVARGVDDAVRHCQLIGGKSQLVCRHVDQYASRFRGGDTHLPAALLDAGRAGGAALVYGDRRVAHEHLDRLERHVELFGDHLADGNEHALAHVHLAEVGRHGAIGVDRDVGRQLIRRQRRLGRDRHSVVGRADGLERDRGADRDHECAAGSQQSAARKGCGFFVSGHDGLPQPIAAAARLTARRMAMCVPQRHFSPVSASRISASVGFFLSRRNAAAVMIQPLMQ